MRTGPDRRHVEEARWTADQIPGAQLVTLPGDADDAYLGDVVEVAAAIRGPPDRSRRSTRRSIGSSPPCCSPTSSARPSAPRRRRPGVEGARRAASREGPGAARTYRGQEVDTAGDGFFATFDGPGRAVRCAQAIVRSVGSLGIEVRAGCIPARSRRSMGGGGLAVVIGARIGGLADRRRCWLRRRCATSRPARGSVRGRRRARAEGRPGSLARVPGRRLIPVVRSLETGSSRPLLHLHARGVSRVHSPT